VSKDGAGRKGCRQRAGEVHEPTVEGGGGREGIIDWFDLRLFANLMAGHFDCDWSLFSHGVAERKRLNLGNLNPIYERELTKLDVHQEGREVKCV
jgi:hypothetical protein